MKTMAAGSFKVHCLAVMDEVQAKRQSALRTPSGEAEGHAPAGEGSFPIGDGFLRGCSQVRAVSDCRFARARYLSRAMKPACSK